jgi:hypothetical protein
VVFWGWVWGGGGGAKINISFFRTTRTRNFSFCKIIYHFMLELSESNRAILTWNLESVAPLYFDNQKQYIIQTLYYWQHRQTSCQCHINSKFKRTDNARDTGKSWHRETSCQVTKNKFKILLHMEITTSFTWKLPHAVSKKKKKKKKQNTPNDTSLSLTKKSRLLCHTPQYCSHPWNYGDCSTETWSKNSWETF